MHQHRSAMAEVVERVRQETGRRNPHALVYCSRSGPPQVPWLEPDVNDHLEDLAAQAAPGVVLIPIGFVSDHMEVIYDLDTEASATARKLDLPAVRAATPGVDPRFVAMVRDLLVERAATERGEDPPARGGRQPPGLVGPLQRRLLPEPHGRTPAGAGRCRVVNPALANTELLDLAVDVAREAAALVRERRREHVEVAATKTSATDVVTQVDRESEALIRGRIHDARPDDGFLGEEGERRRGHLRGALDRRPDRRHRQLPLRPRAVRRVDRGGAGRRGGRRGGARRADRDRVHRRPDAGDGRDVAAGR